MESEVRHSSRRVCSPTRAFGIGILGALALLAGLLLTAAPVHAAGTHFFLETFGSAEEPTFGEPLGMAVEQTTEDLLVIDGEANTVSRWNSDGTPSEFPALGTNVISGLTFGTSAEVQVAVDNSGGETDGNIYIPQVSGSVEIFDEEGNSLGSLTESTEGELAEPCGVAVDSSGNLYVGDFGGTIHKYEPSGAAPVNSDNVANLPFTSNCTLVAGAGSTDGFIFPAKFVGKVSKLDATTGEEKYEVASGENKTVTVNPASGHLYTASGTEVKEFDASGATEATLESSFSPGGEVTGIAVNETTGNVYVARSGNANVEVWGPAVSLPSVITEPPTAVTPVSGTLNGTVNPNGEPLTECYFEWGETTAYGEAAPCEDPDFAEVGEGISPVPVHADVLLKAGTTYHYRLVAASANGSSKGADKTFQVPGATIKAQSASQVTATGAQITGEINPNGDETSFVVQYVTEAQFQASEWVEAIEVPSPPREVGSGTGFVKVIQQLSGLSPQTTYRFRIVAINLTATSQGPNGRFSTFSLPTTDLPDGRAYEMVSPAQKTGEVIPPEPISDLGGSCGECLPGINKPTMPMQSTADGDSVLYEGQPFSGGLAAGPNEYASDRSPGDWSIETLSSPITTGIYQAFSADLSQGVLSQREPALSPEAPKRGDEDFANLYLREEDGSFEPLVSVEPPNRDPAGANPFSIRYAGANAGSTLAPEFSHLIFEANDSLTEEVPGTAPAAPEVEGGDECTRSSTCNLYEWVDGELRLINVLPGNASATTTAVIGGGRLVVQGFQTEAADVDHAISDDGSRIFWSEEESGQVFVRVDGERTLEVPGPGSCKKNIPLLQRACFLTASADGSMVLLSDGQLFELQEEPEAYEPSFNLSEGEGNFKGILGASEDLARIYFIDTADLTDTAENANGEEAEEGKLNLYAWEEGVPSFIGILLADDNTFGINLRFGAWKASPSNRVAQVSPDGSFLAFMTQAPLTGYDNSLSGEGLCTSFGAACREVFLYAADTKALTCASCNPSGQRPVGSSNLSLLRPNLSFPQPNNLSSEGEGRLFFETQDALSPQDVNGNVQDVYQWEPNGVGSCDEADGCVALISSGKSANDSKFLDSSASGDDAFFITRERLLPRDKDEQLDLYDARVGGGFAETPIAPCSGEACAGPLPAAPTQPSSASSASAGPGNPSTKPPKCKKGFVKKHGKCVKKKPKHKNRRAGGK
jgi:hypothetical protein